MYEKKATHVVWMDASLYHRDVKESLPSDLDALRQLQIDAPRSDVFVNGRQTSFPAVDPELSRFCTQSVMGLPLEIIVHSFEGCIVCEHPAHSSARTLHRRMRVEVDTSVRAVRIQKSLRCIEACNVSRYFTVSIDVRIDLVNNVASITFRFGRKRRREHT